jgi:predicted transcriptional regulator
VPKILTIRLDNDLHQQLRHLSINRGESLQWITERLLRKFAERERHTRSKSRKVRKKR